MAPPRPRQAQNPYTPFPPSRNQNRIRTAQVRQQGTRERMMSAMSQSNFASAGVDRRGSVYSVWPGTAEERTMQANPSAPRQAGRTYTMQQRNANRRRLSHEARMQGVRRVRP